MKKLLIILSLILITSTSVNASISEVEIYAIPVISSNLKLKSDILKGSYQGSGTVIDKSGIVLTAYHVIERGMIWVVKYNKKLYYAEPIPRKSSKRYDLALIKIKYEIGENTHQIIPVREYFKASKLNLQQEGKAKLNTVVNLMGNGENILGEISNEIPPKDLVNHQDGIVIKIDRQDISGMSGGGVYLNGKVIGVICFGLQVENSKTVVHHHALATPISWIVTKSLW